MALSSSYVLNQLVDQADLLIATLASTTVVRALDNFRRGRPEEDPAISLKNLRRYVTEEDKRFMCFLYYLAEKEQQENYPEIQQQLSATFNQAEQEIQKRIPDKGIEKLIAFAQDFSSVCLGCARKREYGF